MAPSLSLSLCLCLSFFLAQLLCTCIALLLANLSGVYTHWPKEKAQRKAFIETRQCIEARLRTQRENQQQVSVEAHFLTRNASVCV